jgi:hypothetical protein
MPQTQNGSKIAIIREMVITDPGVSTAKIVTELVERGFTSKSATVATTRFEISKILRLLAAKDLLTQSYGQLVRESPPLRSGRRGRSPRDVLCDAWNRASEDDRAFFQTEIAGNDPLTPGAAEG